MAKKSNNFLINERTARAKAAKKYLDKKKVSTADRMNAEAIGQACVW